MTGPAPSMARAARMLAALAVDPAGLGGMVLRARVGPARAAFEAALARLPGPQHRVPPGISDTQLFGGLNIAATLAEGRPVMDAGLSAVPAALVMPMAERLTPSLAARLAQLLDRGLGHQLFLLDEGVEPDDTPPGALTDRLAFAADLDGITAAEARLLLPAPADLDHARAALPGISVGETDMATLVSVAARFGIDSLRAPILALRTARVLAALDRDPQVQDDHLREAAELVYPSRATMLPQEPEEQASPEPPAPDQGETDPDANLLEALPDEILVSAIAALLPAGLLDGIARTVRHRGASGAGAGARRIGNRRGRPLPARPGKPDGRNRIDPVATLRAAAPWQKMRRLSDPTGRRIILHPSDIHIRRFELASDRLLVFAVDASGSSAMARLAEAKGAVELLLAQAYAKRDQVALIAFRGTGAEVLLPPTRSLVQGKRRLSALPGGGGTPLASGLLSAANLMLQARRRGLTPMLALLTDGRANVALDGQPGRATAQEDAIQMARNLGAEGLDAVLIDIANRPAPQAAELAAALNARYLALPRADARKISAAVDTSLSG
ncbi:magnesium chelatase subunit D [Roseovarius faecimaris]|uniref:Magnesium chelatase subunit D n=1 Tax=Roseovarius faecimaris TaxID=2494550 RepID=A0A6I6IN85_9RHOB|nr:magnesium chelatase subunit D [Roseovarius faecimaris]QGX97742.1 magnesium chelatase subunit D [Roseovarius faecimaris]